MLVVLLEVIIDCFTYSYLLSFSCQILSRYCSRCHVRLVLIFLASLRVITWSVVGCCAIRNFVCAVL